MREDAWLAERLGRPALTVEPGDDPAAVVTRPGVFAQAKVACDDVARVEALEDAGFRVVDVNVTLACDGAKSLDTPTGVTVVDASGSDAADLVLLAREHYTVSRFHRDPHVTAAQAARIKGDWMHAYVDGARGDALWVGAVDGRVSGFLGAIVAEPGVVVIDIVAVHADVRSRGIGRALVARAVEAAEREVRVGTQVANVGALRFYERLGFAVVDTRYVLHLHT